MIRWLPSTKNCTPVNKPLSTRDEASNPTWIIVGCILVVGSCTPWIHFAFRRTLFCGLVKRSILNARWGLRGREREGPSSSLLLVFSLQTRLTRRPFPSALRQLPHVEKKIFRHRGQLRPPDTEKKRQQKKQASNARKGKGQAWPSNRTAGTSRTIPIQQKKDAHSPAKPSTVPGQTPISP